MIAGASGAGKSTLAARTAERHGNEAGRAADDVVHVRAMDGGVVVDPCYPQLKLSAELQRCFPPEPLLRVLVLEAKPSSARLCAARLRPAAALAAMIHHSIAARLFPPPLLQAHFAACRSIARQVPVVRVAYPHTANALQALAMHLASDTTPQPP